MPDAGTDIVEYIVEYTLTGKGRNCTFQTIGSNDDLSNPPGSGGMRSRDLQEGQRGNHIA